MKDSRRKNIYFYMLVVCVSAAIGYLSLGTDFSFDVCYSLQGDGTFTAMLIKGIQEHGIAGIWVNPRIGAPEAATLIDFPAQDMVMSLFIWLLSVFLSSASQIQYTYLIVTFILDACSMALLLRKINIRYEVSFTIAVLFTAAPFHFYRYLVHATLSNYMYFAITMYLALYILGIVKEEKKWKICFCCILSGLGYGYYYAFGLMILAAAYVMKWIRSESGKEALKKIWVFLLVAAAIFVGLLPKIIYGLLYGSNHAVGNRRAVEQELYGLKIIQMLLPPDYSRFEFLNAMNRAYTSKAPLVNENGSASLGLVASVGFLILCVSLIVSFCTVKKKKTKEQILVDFLSLSALILVLMGAIGGFGEIFNYLVTAQIRCYNRSSIYIAGLSYMVIALLLNKLRQEKRKLSGLLCGSILLLGLADQVKILSDNWQEPVKNTQQIYESFFSQAERQLDTGAMVYQLPYLDFPETSSFDYKHFVGYLFTDTLKWSYGGVKGRNSAAKELYIDEGISYRFLEAIKEAGFDAVYIDLDGYEDGGGKVPEFYNSIGVPSTVSEDSRLYLYDISDLKISPEKLLAAYPFVDKLAQRYHIFAGSEQKAEIAKGIEQGEKAFYAKLYRWMTKDKEVKTLTDEEYIGFLYQNILGREKPETQEEKNGWLTAMRNGKSRKEIFYEFLDSQEFRLGQGLQK